MKKVFAAILAVFIAFSWYVTIFGIGPVAPIKDQIKLGLDLSGGVYVVMEADTTATGTDLKTLMDQTQAIIENRVNQMGMSEPVVTIEGEKRIRVELPGADNVDEAINQIGKTAQLQFVLADKRVALDGSQVKDASVAQDKNYGGYVVALKFTSEGAKNFEAATQEIVSGNVTSQMEGVNGNQLLIVLDGEVISDPKVDKVISGDSAQIEGNFTSEQASNLAVLIRGGSLPVELHQVQAGVTGATLGIDALQNAIVSGVIGVILILILMLGLYRVMGLTADLALLLYIPIVLWIMVAFKSVLTLPGIAGMILSIGMAVDANVIIFSRIKEEVREGKSIRVAVNSGFKRAMATVIDSQVTTMIAGIVLYMIGSGSVKGFAMTLMIGIVASIFTAVFVTRLYLEILAESRTFANDTFFSIKRKTKEREIIPFMQYRKIFYLLALVLIVGGIGVGMVRGFNYGIDFTGGTMIQLELNQKVETEQIEKVLDANGVKSATITHAGEGDTQIVIRTTQSLENEDQQKLLNGIYKECGLTDEQAKSALIGMDQFGPSVGKMIKTNAIKALIIACLCMLVYIVVRFEWRFGVAAVIDLMHDVLIMLAFYGLFHIPINNPFIAAILIVVGYSINDTIVMFDRIRENLHFMNRREMEPLVNKSVNQVVGRSIMTSVTTILVIIPLFILGNDVIREFTLPLMVGIISGTISSITVACPLYLQLVNATDQRARSKYQGAEKKVEKKASGYVGAEKSEKKKLEEVEKKAAHVLAEPENMTDEDTEGNNSSTAKKDKKEKKQELHGKRYSKNRNTGKSEETVEAGEAVESTEPAEKAEPAETIETAPVDTEEPKQD